MDETELIDIVASKPGSHASFEKDVYRLKRFVYDFMDGSSFAEKRRFCLDIVTGSVIIRTKDKAFAHGKKSSPVVIPSVGESRYFCLRANPKVSGGRKIDYNAEPVSWIEKKAIKIGVEIQELGFSCSSVWCGKNVGQKNGFYIHDVAYVGRILVRDSVLLGSALRNGVGDSKDFGYGMLQVYRK